MPGSHLVSRPRPAARAGGGLAAAAICAALAGCAASPRQPAAPERTSEAPNAIDVTTVKRVLTVHFADGSLTPAAGQVDALNVLLASGDIGQGDRVLIEGAAGPFGEARAKALASALSREGLKPTVAPRPAWPVDEERLVIEHAVATVRGCPNWSDPPGNNLDNRLHSDFGCATAADLAAMIADPRDLVEGRPLGPVVGDPAVLAIHRYRTGAPAGAREATAAYIPDATTTIPTAGPEAAQAGPPGAAAPADAAAPAGAAVGALPGATPSAPPVGPQ